MRASRIPFGIEYPLLLSSLCFSACASTQSQFPSRDELSKLAERPAANQAQPQNWADVEQWALTGPLPDQASDVPAPTDGQWNGLLVDAAKNRPGLLMASSSANCTARELGIFFAAKRAHAARSLQRFIAARCGMTETLQIVHGYRYQEARGEVDERALFSQWSAILKEELQKAMNGS